MFNDLMENIEWFFNLHDKNKDGFLTKDEVLTLSESLLVSDTPFFRMVTYICVQFIFRYEVGDAYLGAVSRFMSNAFEYGDALLPRPEGADTNSEASTPIESNQPYINLATYVLLLSSMTFIHIAPDSAWLFSQTRFWNRSLRRTFLPRSNWNPSQ